MRLRFAGRREFVLRGFTLVELLLVIGLIALLIGISIFGINKVTGAAKSASTRALISAIDSAIQNYQSSYGALPGPVPNSDIRNSTPVVPIYDNVNPSASLNRKLTGSENLVLALCGGLQYNPTASPQRIEYVPALVGGGPRVLNPANPRVLATGFANTDLTPGFNPGVGTSGHFKDEAGEADDSYVPEFCDKFSSPMPILYLRARSGVEMTGTLATQSEIKNPVITTSNGYISPYTYQGQYDLSQILAYTGSFSGTYPTSMTIDSTAVPSGQSIGAGKLQKRENYYSLKLAALNNTKPLYHGLRFITPALTQLKADAARKCLTDKSNANYTFPYDAYAYFLDPNSNPDIPTPRRKDSYVLISAGPDRVYGTEDDILTGGENVIP